MNEIQDIKQVFRVRNWQERMDEDPRRIYGFLLCSDEHVKFRSFIQRSWRTLDALSGRACDILTLERWEFPRERFEKREYLALGEAGIRPGDRYGYSGTDIALDNGILQVDRVQCLQVRNSLFEDPHKIILPGLVLFTAAWERDAVYIRCNKLSPEQLSTAFQEILGSVQTAYKGSESAVQTLARFRSREMKRKLRRRASSALLRLSLMDLVEILGEGLRFVAPKAKGGSKL